VLVKLRSPPDVGWTVDRGGRLCRLALTLLFTFATDPASAFLPSPQARPHHGGTILRIATSIQRSPTSLKHAGAGPIHTLRRVAREIRGTRRIASLNDAQAVPEAPRARLLAPCKSGRQGQSASG